MRLKGKTSIVTGGGSGQGRAAAILFAQEGSRIVVADINVEGGEETVRMIEESGGDAMFVRVDVRNVNDVKNLMEKTIRKYDRIDVLYNNAGISIGERMMEDISEEVWDRIIDINLKGVFLCSKYVIPEMKKTGGGSIINTASIWGIVAAGRFTAYSASKGGVVALTKSMALEYAPDGIRVNCICPGAIDTPMLAGDFASATDPEEAHKIQLERTPLGRLGKPEDIAYAALYLASDESSWVTGASFVIDGGEMAH